jgi:hypothetical protein
MRITIIAGFIILAVCLTCPSTAADWLAYGIFDGEIKSLEQKAGKDEVDNNINTLEQSYRLRLGLNGYVYDPDFLAFEGEGLYNWLKRDTEDVGAGLEVSEKENILGQNIEAVFFANSPLSIRGYSSRQVTKLSDRLEQTNIDRITVNGGEIRFISPDWPILWLSYDQNENVGIFEQFTPGEDTETGPVTLRKTWDTGMEYKFAGDYLLSINYHDVAQLQDNVQVDRTKTLRAKGKKRFRDKLDVELIGTSQKQKQIDEVSGEIDIRWFPDQDTFAHLNYDYTRDKSNPAGGEIAVAEKTLNKQTFRGDISRGLWKYYITEFNWNIQRENEDSTIQDVLTNKKRGTDSFEGSVDFSRNWPLLMLNASYIVRYDLSEDDGEETRDSIYNELEGNIRNLNLSGFSLGLLSNLNYQDDNALGGKTESKWLSRLSVDSRHFRRMPVRYIFQYDRNRTEGGLDNKLELNYINELEIKFSEFIASIRHSRRTSDIAYNIVTTDYKLTHRAEWSRSLDWRSNFQYQETDNKSPFANIRETIRLYTEITYRIKQTELSLEYKWEKELDGGQRKSDDQLILFRLRRNFSTKL